MEPRRELVRSSAALVGLGALCGVAWAAALRAYMIELAGAESAFDWWGTVGAILVPGAVVGALLGWAEDIRRRGGRPGWRSHRFYSRLARCCCLEHWSTS